jgi:hypothetical protein
VALSGAGAEVSPLLRPRIVDSGTAQKKYLFAKARRNWHARAAYSAGATKAALAPHRAILKQGCLRFNGNRSKAMTIQTRAIVAIAMLAGSFGFASAQTTTFTGPQGQYMGNAGSVPRISHHIPRPTSAMCRFRLLNQLQLAAIRL